MLLQNIIKVLKNPFALKKLGQERVNELLNELVEYQKSYNDYNIDLIIWILKK